MIFGKKPLILAAAAFAFACPAGAIGLTQVHEAQPYKEQRPGLEELGVGTMILDLIFGSNYVSWSGGTSVKDAPGDYAFTNWVNNGDFYHKKLGDDWRFTASLVQRDSWISSHGGPTRSRAGLNSIWIDNILVHHEADSPWSQHLALSPGVSSDFGYTDASMLRLPVQFGVRYEVSNELSLGLGVAYTPDFVRAPVLPVPGITWKPAEDWTTELNFTSLTVTHRLAPRTTLGAFVSYDEASWMVGTKEDFRLVSYATGSAGVEFTQGFDITDTNPAVIHLAVGSVFGGAVREYDADGSDLRGSAQLAPGVFTRVGLTIKF